MSGCVQKIIPALAGDYSHLVIPLLNSAKDQIDILMYQWKWYGHAGSSAIQRLNLAFISAARRGVKIRALLNLDHIGGPISQINSRTETQLKAVGIETKHDFTGITSHAKMVLIDKEILVLGSHNFSARSMSGNNEASVIIRGVDEVQPFQKYFQRLWERY